MRGEPDGDDPSEPMTDRACRSTTHYKTEDSAKNAHRAKYGGKVPVRCETCGGWVLVRKDEVRR